jgi:tetratricopeptide (TPR) repeat protein
MSQIALRDYHRKIERLIEDQQSDQALSHCVNILQIYPKEIETYRKLGKIFLDKQDYNKAERVFKIILAVFPDDFVAHVGLSFIFEQNNNLDKSIQHMQYAFELQPVNETLQDELKRLYNKRDHVEPAKIRLTRGALIKMYARSDLYEQAIAEIQLGLYEKPGRIDFKQTLADMLWKSSKNIDAVEVCMGILSQFPYCWVANEIMDKSSQELNPNQTENHNRTRLIELNPYYQYMLPATKNIADIPDIAVQIEADLPADLEVPSFDWDEFLKNAWVASPIDAYNPEAGGELNWSSILDEAIDGSSSKPADGDNPESNADNNEPSSKKQTFIERLQKRNLGEENLIEIPDWILEEEQAHQNQDETEILSEVNPDNESVDDTKVEETPQRDELLVNLPEIKDESGLIDQDAPVQIPDQGEIAPLGSEWIQDPSTEPDEPALKQPLQDTQRINIVLDSADEILSQAAKAIEGNNIQFALKHLLKLAEQNDYLEEIRDVLEDACEKHPTESGLWLALGGIYQRLDLTEKALEVFIRAQKQISL